MTYRIIVEPGAKAEIADAAIFYEGRAAGLGDEFLGAVDQALRRIGSNPAQYQMIRLRGQVRRAFVGRFPYILFYVTSGRDVVVRACFHNCRDPKRLQARLRSPR